MLKPVREPSLDEFYSLIEKAQETAKKIGLTEEDINAVIREMREAEMRIVACAAAEKWNKCYFLLVLNWNKCKFAVVSK